VTDEAGSALAVVRDEVVLPLTSLELSLQASPASSLTSPTSGSQSSP
jgi:hypothetical protein